MRRRTRLCLAAVLLAAIPVLPGCQSGGGFMHTSNFLSGLSFGNRAPMGQSEPEIVLRDEGSGSEDAKSRDNADEF